MPGPFMFQSWSEYRVVRGYARTVKAVSVIYNGRVIASFFTLVDAKRWAQENS